MIPTRFKKFKKAFGSKPFKLLDVGAGNFSASTTKRVFPNCEYHGIDRVKDYNNAAADHRAMTAFYQMDLTQLEFSKIPNNTFDAILMAHIIEHLKNGDEVIRGLTGKLKKGGYIYIEYPSKASEHFPSKPGTLNFYDDPTHVRIYTTDELSQLLIEKGFTVIEAQTRRDWRNILLMPLNMAKSLLRRGEIRGSVYWDWYGFAEYVWARKD
jgi:ubiquinone/menaquinone biosynthesis C-methylase UbiE